MSVINCPNCSKKISDSNDNCPNCGYPIDLMKMSEILCYTVVIFMSIIFFLVLLNDCINNYKIII